MPDVKADVGHCLKHNRYFDRSIEESCVYCEPSRPVCDTCTFKKAQCEMQVPGFPENDDPNIGVLE